MRDALTTIGSISAIIILVVFSSDFVSIKQRLKETHNTIRSVESNLERKFVSLEEQFDSDSLDQEMAFNRLEKQLQERASENASPEKAPSPKATSNAKEPPLRKLQPELSPSEKIIFKEIMALIKNGDKEAALDLIYASINEESSAALYFLAGSLLGENRETGKALDFFLTALDKFPNFYRAARNAGIMQVQTQDFQESKRNLLKAQSLGIKPDTTTNGLLALSYLNTGDPISAEQNYRTAIELNPDIKDWWLGLSKSLLQQGKDAEAQEAIGHIEKTFGPIPESNE